MKISKFSPQTLPEYLLQLRIEGVPASEEWDRASHFLDLKSREKGIPLHGTFELTPLCNLDCKMCYVHLPSSRYSRSRLLSVETWKSLMTQAKEAGMFKASFTGGEALTYPGFEELWHYLHFEGIQLSLMTNGLLLNDERVEFLRMHRPYAVQVTLYGGSEEEYEAVTGFRVFHRVMENIRRVRDAGLPVRISLTPNRFMGSDFGPLLEAADSLGVPWRINARLLPPRPSTEREKEDLSDEEYLELYCLQAEMKGRSLTPQDLSELPDEPATGDCTGVTESCGLRCGGGRSSFCIRYDGKMTPCVSLYDQTTDPLADGFQQAWQNLRKLADDYQVPVECASCAWHGSCLVCPAMHRAAEPGHCDPDICKRTKKLAAAGFIPVPAKKGGPAA